MVRAYPRQVVEGHYGYMESDLSGTLRGHVERAGRLSAALTDDDGIAPWLEAALDDRWAVLVRRWYPARLADAFPPGGALRGRLLDALEAMLGALERLAALAAQHGFEHPPRLLANNMLLDGARPVLVDWLLDGPRRAVEQGAAPIPVSYDAGSFPSPHGDDPQHALALAYCVLRTGALPWPESGLAQTWKRALQGTADLDALPDPGERALITRGLAREWPSARALIAALRERAL